MDLNDDRLTGGISKADHIRSCAVCSSGAPLLRAPVAGDATPMWQLAVDTATLDVNSPYAYLLVCTHFASTSIVAEEPDGAGLAGFVAAYRLPDDPEVLFVWQIGVSARRRGAGLGRQLLKAVSTHAGGAALRWIEATITPSNHPSKRLFESFARSVSAPCKAIGSFAPALFPGGNHQPEVLYRIGPLPIEVDQVKRGR